MEAPTHQPQEREISYEDALADQDEAFSAEPPTPRPRPGQDAQPPQHQPVSQVQQQPQTPPIAHDHDQAPPQPVNSTEAEEAQEAIDVLVPKAQPRQWTFGNAEVQRTYVQRELSVIAKTQWFSLVGEVLDKALGGSNSLSLNSLLSPPENVRPGSGQLRVQDFQDADTFVHALGKLLVYAPEFFEKSICIWLAVPDYEWDLARQLMKVSPDLGGLSDDDGEEIVAIFLDQNYGAIEAFFRDRFGHLRDRWRQRRKDSQSRSPRR